MNKPWTDEQIAADPFGWLAQFDQIARLMCVCCGWATHITGPGEHFETSLRQADDWFRQHYSICPARPVDA